MSHWKFNYTSLLLLCALLLLAVAFGKFLRGRSVVKVSSLTDNAGNTYTLVYEKRYFWSGKVERHYQAATDDSIIEVTIFVKPEGQK